MMIQEFIDRTGYAPTSEEYRYIEESYYDSPLPTKDDFCIQWLKDLQSGKWDMEYQFRKMLAEQKAEYEAKIAELQETVKWYNEQYYKQRAMIKQAEAEAAKNNMLLASLKARAERMVALFED